MTIYARIRDVPTATLTFQAGWQQRNELGWFPLRESEVLLAAHFYPLALGAHGEGCALGAVVHDALQERRLVGASGQWLGAYMPMAMRCFPFRLPAADATAPLDLEYAALPLSEGTSQSLTLREPSGEPSAMLCQLHQELSATRASIAHMAAALDALQIADVFVDLAAGTGGVVNNLKVLNLERFAGMSPAALSALCRASFHPAEIAVAMAYSRRNLTSEARQRTGGDARELARTPELNAPLAIFGMSNFSLDESELYSAEWLQNHSPTINAREAKEPND